MQVKATTQIIGLDLLRFAAATAVMFHHFAFVTWAMPSTRIAQLSGQLADTRFLGPVTNYGWIGVELFFVISGFVIAFSARHESPREFLLGRASRLLPAAWICATISFLISAIVSFKPPASLTNEWLRSVFFSPIGPWIDDVYWTLGIEVVFYTVVLGLLKIRRFCWIERLALVIGLTSTLYAFLTLDRLGVSLDCFPLNRGRLTDLLLIRHGSHFAIGILL
jgi:peptidoglycan/LPS O-acetylase OafA/YrhL